LSVSRPEDTTALYLGRDMPAEWKAGLLNLLEIGEESPAQARLF
jgi:hypothetical protein